MKKFYLKVKGQDSRFCEWGAEDTHFAYKVYAYGGILAREETAWGYHVRIPNKHADQSRYNSSNVLFKQLTPHFRDDFDKTGRNYLVPKYVVNVQSCNVDAIVNIALDVLRDEPHDLILRINVDRISDYHAKYVEYTLGHDARVKFGLMEESIIEYPDSPYHIYISSDKPVKRNIVRRLTTLLQSNGRLKIKGGGYDIRMDRSWVAHRINDYGCNPEDVALIREVSVNKIAVRRWRPISQLTTRRSLKYKINWVKDNEYPPQSIPGKVLWTYFRTIEYVTNHMRRCML